ncbi:MAG: hypothetical protein IPK87_11795 [Planctomycetes bacterium]|nr:hypothetical protein [Planctomycetota bacterium]
MAVPFVFSWLTCSWQFFAAFAFFASCCAIVALAYAWFMLAWRIYLR